MRATLSPALLAPVLLGLGLALAAPGLAAAQSAPAASPAAPGSPAAPQTPAADAAADAAGVQQMALTPALVDQFVAANKEVNAILDKLPDGTDQPDPATLAKLDATAQKYKFADYKQYDAVESNIGIVMAGIDPQTKQYIGPDAVIKKQIAQVEADKQISAKDKKDTVDQLNAALPTVPKLQYPGNVDVVVKSYDKLNETMPQD
ncbi:hypothetical protein D3273_02655 [Lichenibacterium minor]|uniref:Uncharacterized protein n=1 Tax=Lichenibacterium minor TaxID=2316528 RepID=A0A4Q2U9C2_9HYPH|nr:hypothetical protein [Lichenibacterium minor]RYC33393.1 hypothetical protein D3273_02655 [Lichenibacterium minor]